MGVGISVFFDVFLLFVLFLDVQPVLHCEFLRSGSAKVASQNVIRRGRTGVRGILGNLTLNCHV